MFELKLIEKHEEIAVNSFISNSINGNFRQTTHWGEIKKASGWDYACYALKKDCHIVAVATILIRKLGRLPFSLMYCCRGPIVDWSNSEVVSELFSQLVAVVNNHKGLCLRFDPEPDEWFEKQNMLLKQHQVICITERITVWNRALYSSRVMLDADEERLFKKMKRHLRRNVSEALSAGVEVTSNAAVDDKEIFHNLMTELEKRKNSLIHNRDYYDQVYDVIVNSGNGVFLKAVYEEKVISCTIIAMTGNKAWWLYVANDYSFRHLTPNKLLMWESIKVAKNAGCSFLDLGSTQGTDEFDPETDNLDKLKSACSPTIINFTGYYDVPGRYYRTFRFLEKDIFPRINNIYYKAQRFLSSFKKK